MEPELLFEDDDMVVANKPAGMVVNRAATVKTLTLQDWADQHLKLKKSKKASWAGEGDFQRRSGIVHRLDKETSGVLIIAKSAQVFLALTKQFAAREVKKTYLALVHGQVKPRQGKISAPIKRNPFNRQRFGIFPGGREAETFYELVRSDRSPTGEQLSLVRLRPITGRTHQLRVHLKYAGWPIVADSFYTGRKQARRDKEWCPRLFLHAESIGFSHPTSGRAMKIESPLPKDLQAVIDKLES